MVAKIKIKNKEDTLLQNIEGNYNTIFLKPITEQETLKYIKELKISSSAGFDKISNKILHLLAKHLVTPMTKIINTSFISAVCPTHFKKSIIKPILKPGTSDSVKSYRPISIISNLAKVFEKALKNRIVDVPYKIVIDYIYRSIDDSLPCIVVFIDLAKAFDYVSHKRLIEKLSKIGIGGKALELIKSYLSNGIPKVKVNNTLSESLTIKHVIPQGTVLGPVLSALYINDLVNINIDGTIISYDVTWENLK